MSVITTSQHTTLSIGQLHILEMMNRCRTEESLKQLKKLLFDFYAKEGTNKGGREQPPLIGDYQILIRFFLGTNSLPFLMPKASYHSSIWGRAPLTRARLGECTS